MDAHFMASPFMPWLLTSPRRRVPRAGQYALSGRLAEALPLLEQAVAWVTSGHRMGTAYPLWITHLGEAYLLAGRIEDAGQLARRALAPTRGLNQQGYEAYALRLLGEVARRRAPLEVEPAAAAYQQAITLAEPSGCARSWRTAIWAWAPCTPRLVRGSKPVLRGPPP